jgi:PAS domain S-box-containing protein
MDKEKIKLIAELEKEKESRLNADQKLKEMEIELAELRDQRSKHETDADQKSWELNRLSSLVNSLNGAILVESEERRIVTVNESFCNMFSVPVPPEQMIGMDCSQQASQVKVIFSEPDAFEEGIDKLLNKKKPKYNERLDMVDGRILERDYIPFFHNNKYAGHLWHYRDITKEINAEESIKKSEEKYRNIIRNMKLGLLEIDVNGIIVRGYPWFCEMTGYTKEELEGKNGFDLLVPDEFKDKIREELKLRAQGKESAYEMQVKRKNGEILWVLVSGSPVYDTSGKITGSISIHLDITESKQFQERLLKAKKEADSARNSEREFLAKMSHEIRTPLNSIIGMSYLLSDSNLDDKQKKYLSTLKSSSELLNRLITNILDLSKMESGHYEPRNHVFNIRDLIKSIINSLRMQTENKPVTIELEKDKNIPTWVNGDDLALQQVLINLIGNAIKFTNEGSVYLRVKVNNEDSGEINLYFEVEDTGMGISKDLLKSIFNKYKQGEKRGKQSVGTGLGLTISKELIESHGGKIDVDSIEGKGSTFKFTMKFEKVVSEFKSEGISKSVIVNKDNVSILVVEDNKNNIKYISELLTRWGYKYEVCTTGKEVRKVYNDKKFDFIFMDIQLPDANGYELTREIRASGGVNAESNIIALSASAFDWDIKEAYNSGMTDYLSKPFTPIELKSIFGNVSKNEVKTSNDNPYLEALDSKRLLLLYENDTKFAFEMFNMFVSMVPFEVEKLLKTKDKTELKSVIHNIKPNFGQVGLTELENSLEEIEMGLENGSLDDSSINNAITKVINDISSKIPLVQKQLNILNNIV